MISTTVEKKKVTEFQCSIERAAGLFPICLPLINPSTGEQPLQKRLGVLAREPITPMHLPPQLPAVSAAPEPEA